MTRLYATIGAIFLAALLGGTFAYQKFVLEPADPYADCRTGAIAGGPIGGPFTLVDAKGQTVTDAQVFAKPALVYFGYTFCADVCPLDNARNVEAASLLAAQGLDVTPVFITVDPNRDTPKVMADYTSNIGDALVGLTGTPAQIKTVAQAFKVYYKIPDNPGPTYDVDHTTLTYLMLPKTGFADFFQRETTAKEMAQRTSCFLKTG